jgi:rhodanese-related sulfurtransferase
MITIQKILHFTQSHWQICAVFTATLLLVIWEELKNNLSGMPKIAAKDVPLLINREDAIIFDLREAKMFAAGHILGSVNIIKSAAESKQTIAYKSKTIILLDTTNALAATFGNKLKQQGFTKITILDGGISSWQNAGLPLAKN